MDQQDYSRLLMRCRKMSWRDRGNRTRARVQPRRLQFQDMMPEVIACGTEKMQNRNVPFHKMATLKHVAPRVPSRLDRKKPLHRSTDIPEMVHDLRGFRHRARRRQASRPRPSCPWPGLPRAFRLRSGQRTCQVRSLSRCKLRRRCSHWSTRRNLRFRSPCRDPAWLSTWTCVHGPRATRASATAAAWPERPRQCQWDPSDETFRCPRPCTLQASSAGHGTWTPYWI
mmetsp:Transcript_55980/g.115972  ORF Transcript_55980/g.115972 Transcript_55980/m.115972 type:complete len:227 (+) Transcript_55980:84-764(+)